MNDSRDCSMCRWYDMAMEYCGRYKEAHYPSDGSGCPGWEYWDEPENREGERNI